MANDLATRPIKVDTVMGAGAGLGRPLKVTSVYWFNPTSVGDTFTIIDPVSSKVLLQGRAEADAQSQIFDFAAPQDWRDFRVSALVSGILFIYTT